MGAVCVSWKVMRSSAREVGPKKGRSPHYTVRIYSNGFRFGESDGGGRELSSRTSTSFDGAGAAGCEIGLNDAAILRVSKQKVSARPCSVDPPIAIVSYATRD
ncbi:hypothetical protein PIB30_027133 [Stylosanthes scabra]|uniref:Uncharacterized protein n=1 Tax=Stylosanthes scabra TaxID=79078 RepID=A0ABU6XAN1_9FABA|nr:hypothetical protein [Stylosanthes scabra]